MWISQREAEARGDRGGRGAVLAGAGLGDDALLAHAAREERLTQAIVQLVGAEVVEVLALEQDREAEVPAQALGVVERGRAAAVVQEFGGELALEEGVVAIEQEGVLERLQGGLERRRHEASAVGAEETAVVGQVLKAGLTGGHGGDSWFERGQKEAAGFAGSRRRVVSTWARYLCPDPSLRRSGHHQ